MRASGPRTTCSATSTASGSRAPRSRPTRRATARSTCWPTRPRRRCATSSSRPRPREPGTEERKFGDLYASFMDEERVEELGATPLTPLLSAVAAVESIDDAARHPRPARAQGRQRLLPALRRQRPGQPGALPRLPRAGRPRPARRVLLPRGEVRRDPRRSTVALPRADVRASPRLDDAAGRAQRVFDARDRARRRTTGTTSRPATARSTYNLRTLGPDRGQPDLDQLAAPRSTCRPGALDELVVRQPSFVEGARRAAHRRPPRGLAGLAALAGHPLLRRVPAPSDFVEANFDFYGRPSAAPRRLRARWKRGVSLVEGAMGEAVGKIYVERHFPPEAQGAHGRAGRQPASRPTAQSITDARLDDATRPRASARWRSSTSSPRRSATRRSGATTRRSQIDPTTCSATCGATTSSSSDRELGKIGKPVDRDEWFMTPQTVNAYYNPGINEIVFPAAILQPPFFDADADDAANYGGDRRGHRPRDRARLRRPGLQVRRRRQPHRLVDATTDRAAFEKLDRVPDRAVQRAAPRARCPDHHVNGALTIGENIGDLGGLGIAWKAYLLSLDGEEPPVIDGADRRAAVLPRPGRRPGSSRPATRRSSGCLPSTRTPRTSSAATRSCATSTSSIAPSP